jgi:hypothetical protein
VASPAVQIEERIALVIVDSSMALFRVDFSGQLTTMTSQQSPCHTLVLDHHHALFVSV